MGNNKDRWSALSMQERADLIKLYTREGITDLKSIRKHYNGIPYRDLNTSEYDYFNASPDMVPTKEGEHWGSRNPHTGQILKREDHPTFDLATEGEDKAGYIIKRGIDGNLYSLPKRSDNYVEEVNNYSNGGNISWEDIDNFADKAEPWISGASLVATGASFIPGAQPVAVPAAVVLNGAGIALDTYQAARALSQKDYKDAIINGGEALLGMFGSKAASKIAKTAAGKYIGKIKEQMVNERLVNSGEKMVRLMRKGKTQEEAAEQVLKNAVNYVENSTKVKDITNTIYDKYINRGNTVSSVGDAIADGYDLIEGIDWNPLNEIKPAFISETKSYGGRILSGEKNTEKKPIFDPEKIIKNVPAREFGPQKVMGENDFLVMPGTNITKAPIQYYADKGTGKENIEVANQIISDFDAREDKQKHIDENSDYYRSYLDAKYYLDHVEALKKYLGLPYDTNIIKESAYKPTRLQDTNEKTYKFANEEDPKHWNSVVESMVRNGFKERQYFDPILTTFTAYRDRDDKGDFISIYDDWDYNLAVHGGLDALNKPIEKVTGGKPFVIYDRIYLDDYYDIPEEFRGNPYITPAVLTDTNAYMETSYKNGGKLTKKCK